MTGDYFKTLDMAVKAADYAGFKRQQQEAAKRGKLRGIGICTYIEACAMAPSVMAGQAGSFMDYCMPRADNFLPFKLETNTTLCAHNPLGAKGCGEAGTIGAPGAIMNAVVDALAPLGIVDLDMPATSERVWRAMTSAASH
jgi:aerobic carbon-monoxide dehydrogenase large subunit